MNYRQEFKRHAAIGDIALRGYKEKSGQYLECEWYAEEFGDTIVIAHRGTEMEADTFSLIRDWGRNCLLFPYRTKHLPWCHLGFGRGGAGAVPGIVKMLKLKGWEQKPLTLCGHSKGVESAAAAMILHGLDYNVAEWVGFGCPGMWYSKGSMPFPARTYRFGNDIVPRITPLFHRCQEVQIGEPLRNFWNWEGHPLPNYIETLREASRQI